MKKAIIDTNILLVANGQHADVSEECIAECVQRLQDIEKEGVVVLDDAFHILGEYLHKTNPNHPRGVGDVFLKRLLQNLGNPARVEMVRITELAEHTFAEFPDPNLEPIFDGSDRKFAAVANVHPEHPPIWQAADSKWLDWWQPMEAKGLRVEFLCPGDVCQSYRKKFPNKPLPPLP